jgi:hypothetical protein
MVRAFNRRRYVLAGIITLIIFFLGLSLGLIIDSKRINFMQDEGKSQKLDFNSLQLQYQFIDQLSQEQNCNATMKSFDSMIRDLENTRERLETYNQNSKINKDEYQLLRREYTLSQLQYWLFATKAKVKCPTDLATVLYFYSTEEECPSCDEQAFVLDYLKRIFKDKLLIFALDSKMTEEPMIKLLMNSYGVTSFPGIVVEDKVYNGFVDKEQILSEICMRYRNNDVCSTFLALENETSKAQ